MNESSSAVNDSVDAGTTSTDSAPVETNVPEVAEQSAFSKALLSDDDSPTDVETEADTTEAPSTEEPKQDADETDTDEQPLRKADKRNQQLDQEIADQKERLGIDPSVEIRNKVELRNYLRELSQVDLRNNELATEQELLQTINPETGDYFTVQDAQRISRQQAIEAEQQANSQTRYGLEVQQNRTVLDSDSQRVLQELPIFNPQSPEYKPTIAQQAANLMESNLIRDPNTPEIDPSTGQPTGQGMVIGFHNSPYQVYSAIAAAYQESKTEGQIQGQRNTEKMLANVDTAPGSAPAKKPVDPFRLGFNSDD